MMNTQSQWSDNSSSLSDQNDRKYILGTNKMNTIAEVNSVFFSYDFMPDLGQMKVIIRIQSYFRMKLEQMKLKQIKKMANYRRYVLQELVETEENYINDLATIINEVLIPIKQQEILDEIEVKRLFINIEQVYGLNNGFLKEIKELFQKYHYRQCYGKVFSKYVQFFKIYYDYTSNFSVELVDHYRRQNVQKLQKEFDQFVQSSEHLYRGLNLEAFLIKPVQRLPKYILLVKDLIKHTEKDHLDYSQLKQSLDQFIVVNTQINNMIDRLIKNQTIFELQRQYFDHIGEDIVQSSRDFLQTEVLSILVYKQKKTVSVYICNDLLILTERIQHPIIGTHSKLTDYLFLDCLSFCKVKAENEYYRHQVSVKGKQKSITFICSDSEQKKNFMNLLEKLILDLKEQQGQICQSNCDIKYHPISVNAQGVETRQQFLKKFTVYVMNIKFAKQSFTLSVRYRNMTHLEEVIRKDFKGLDLPHLSKSQWLSNQQTAVIEGRKIILENFLETLLNSDEIKNDPAKVLSYLELPRNFYEMAQLTKEDSIDSSNKQILQNIKNHKGSITIECEMPISQQKFKSSRSLNNVEDSRVFEVALRHARSHTIRNSQAHRSAIMNGGGKWIEIELMDSSIIKEQITEDMRAIDVVEFVSNKLGLRCFDDFKLIEINGANTRILDDEDSFPLAFHHTVDKQNILGKFLNVFKDNQKFNKKMVLKKFIFLSKEIEEQEYEQDITRLKLICHQLFDDIYNDYFKMEIQTASFYAACFLFIKYIDTTYEIHSQNSLPFEQVKQILSPKYLKGVQINQFKIDIFHQVQFLKDFVKNILPTQNVKDLKLRQQQIIGLKFLEKVQQEQFYGMSFYKVNIPQDTKDKLHFEKCHQEAYFGINYQYLVLLTIQDRSLLHKTDIDEVKEVEKYPFFINLVLKDQTKLKIDTKQGLEISKLIEIYKQTKKDIQTL